MRHAILLVSLALLLPALALGNTVATSTMEFHGSLTDNGDGTYTGVLPMIDGDGFDIFAKEGASAWFGDAGVWTEVVIADNDGWPAWTLDTPDWYQYSIEFYEEGGLQRWAVRNHAGATEVEPWSVGGVIAKGVPMSGVVNWGSSYAAETDIGAYLPGTGTGEIPGGAALNGGGRACWDMDWSWGSEVVPLEYPGFHIDVTPDGGEFDVTLTPAPAPLNVDTDWHAFVIRENAVEGPPLILGNSSYGVDAVEIATFASSQKAGLGTDLINGATVAGIAALHVDRLDDVAASGSLYGPYFNIWVTDGLGHYAVIANEPSNAEWAGSPWDVSDWNFLKTKTCKVYETAGAGAGTSWVHVYADATSLTFEDVAGLLIAPPSTAYIAASGDIGSGAPDELGTNIARGFNWMFGDTAANYVSGDGEGFVVANYTATATIAAPITATPATSGPINCAGSQVVTFGIELLDGMPDLFLYDMTVRATGEVTFGPITDSLPFTADDKFFYTTDNHDGSWTITGSTFANPSHPVTAPGTADLFSIRFDAASEGTAVITVESIVLRDPDNVTFPAFGFGTHIDVDCTPPAAVTGITAAPHHLRIAVDWVHSGDDVDHYEVFSGLWHDGAHATIYPEYDDVVGHAIPTRPADHAAILANSAEWTDLGDIQALSTEQTWLYLNQRGVYYYEVFAVDAAGNASPPAAANDRATNYWLGDVNGSGFVNVAGDITPLGNAFGTRDGEGDDDYNAYCDVGPTDDMSRVGIPTTDDVINFEDLMVFCMNFGIVSDANKSMDAISPTAQLAWIDAGAGRYALRLLGGTGIKGLHVRADLPEGAISGVTAGQLLDDQDEMTFLKNIGDALDISVAVMGQGNGFTGTGDLLFVDSALPIAITDLTVEVRGHDNTKIQTNLDETVADVPPRVFFLKNAYPNPFNPMTKIAFSLPEAQDVRLDIYSVDGAKVATLINETRGAGLHEVIWNGRNDAGQMVASGMYFYRIEAGPYSQVRKMTLMK